MLPEWKRINDSHYTILISWILLLQSLKDFVFDLSVLNIEFLVSADLQCQISPAFFKVDTFDYLTKGTFVNDGTD